MRRRHNYTKNQIDACALNAWWILNKSVHRIITTIAIHWNQQFVRCNRWNNSGSSIYIVGVNWYELMLCCTRRFNIMMLFLYSYLVPMIWIPIYDLIVSSCFFTHLDPILALTTVYALTASAICSGLLTTAVLRCRIWWGALRSQPTIYRRYIHQSKCIIALPAICTE